MHDMAVWIKYITILDNIAGVDLRAFAYAMQERALWMMDFLKRL